MPPKDRQSRRLFVLFLVGLFVSPFCAIAAHAQWTAMNPVKQVQQQPDGVVFTMGTGTLKVQVCSDSVIHVLYSPTASFPKRVDYVVTKESWPTAQWTMQSTDDAVTLATSLLKITVTRKDGAIAYAEAHGDSLVQESSRSLTPEKMNGEDTYRAESLVSIYGSHEGLYGLGQHQAGVWNYRGESVDISQENSNISVPLMLSSKGYGIFWNNTSRSRFNNRFANILYISSEVADIIDYYFLYGPELDKIKYAKPPYHTNAMAVYDATNPEARKYYWDLVNKGLFNIGLDAWWMDTTEPETEGQEENILLNHKLAAGSGNRYLNAYPLLDTEAVYQGQRSASDKKRVFILSRSAFAGSQRNAVTAWSGDINSDWLSFRRQVPAGLNFSLSGIPYWTTDIGGFVFGSPSDPAFRELFIRWFQYGTFNPILRVHGTRHPDENELWSYGPDAQTILVNFDRLRYRMLPYIYSLAWKTTSEAYTPMRPLVMDFRTDP